MSGAGQPNVLGGPFPDEVARQLWDDVADTSTRINETIDEIAWLTVGGAQTRSELAQALDHLKQAAEILERTSDREALRFKECERLYPTEVWGEKGDAASEQVRP